MSKLTLKMGTIPSFETPVNFYQNISPSYSEADPEEGDHTFLRNTNKLLLDYIPILFRIEA
jgi:hypothetical protein